MVALIDPPVDAAPTASRKRGGGPRTPRGRMRSRENSVRESFRSKVVFSRHMASRILDRNLHLQNAFHPKTRYELMLIADMALAKARIDRANELQIENANRYIGRTACLWDHDQKMRALEMRKRLAKDPARIQHRLSGFKQGVELLISEWSGLAAALEATGEWDESQKSLSFDLRGVWPELRVGDSLFPPTVEKATLAATAAREIARLREMKETWLDALDEEQQDDALEGLAPDDDATTKRLRRYERMSIRDYDKAHAELLRVQADREERFKHTGFQTTLRAWDVDCLLERLKAIQDPPVAADDIEAGTPPARRCGEVAPPPVANSPVSRGVSEARGTVASAHVTSPIVTKPETAAAAVSPSESDAQAVTTTVISAPRPGSVIDLPAAVPTRPASRRARKTLQKRLRERARKEGKRDG